jgi:V/A-type H+-transporting ATPase subunit A
LHEGNEGSLTIGGTVSPAGGNFEEPVTQATLKVVGAFHGLSRDRANARRFPSIHPLDSWTKYDSFVPKEIVDNGRNFLRRGSDVGQMMMVVGEEGTSLEDFVVYLKGEFLDAVYLQQNGFDPVDAACAPERQLYVAKLIDEILNTAFSFEDKEDARKFFYNLRQLFTDWNYMEWESEDFKNQESVIRDLIKGK